MQERRLRFVADSSERSSSSKAWTAKGVLPLLSKRLMVVDPRFVHDDRFSLIVPVECDFLHVRVQTFTHPDFGTVIAKVLFSRDPEKAAPTTLRGEVSVDSASLVAFDPHNLPCWVSPDAAKARCGSTFIDRSGIHWHCSLHGTPPPIFAGRSFVRFSDPIAELGGKSMNELREDGIVQENRWMINGDEFSSEGAFAARTGPDDCGFLNLNRSVAAFTFTSGYGDGTYQVFADRTSVLIDLAVEDEE